MSVGCCVGWRKAAEPHASGVAVNEAAWRSAQAVLLPAVMFSVMLITGNRLFPVLANDDSGVLSRGSKPVNGLGYRTARDEPRNARVMRW